MGWEKRGNKKYYYRKKRIGNKVISEYVGSGPAAEKIARENELARRMRNEEQQAWRKSQAEQRSIDDLLDSIERITRILIHANLLLAGFHTHKGQWRKKRNEKKNKK